jgi:hypothetical protein
MAAPALWCASANTLYLRVMRRDFIAGQQAHTSVLWG